MITPEAATVTKALQSLANRVRSLELTPRAAAYGFYTGSFTSVAGASAGPSSWTYVEGASPVTPVGGTFRVDVEGVYLVDFGCAASSFATGRSYVIVGTTPGRIALTPIPSGERNATAAGLRHLAAGDVITPQLNYTSATAVTCDFAVTLLSSWPAPFLAPPAP